MFICLLQPVIYIYWANQHDTDLARSWVIDLDLGPQNISHLVSEFLSAVSPASNTYLSHIPCFFNILFFS